jgi:hypothetical protein
MAKKLNHKSGRVAFNDNGSSEWEWRTDTGNFSREIDTQRLKQLQEEAAVALKDESVDPRGFDPYRTTASPAPQKAPRRTLDDMRELSEEIKRTTSVDPRGFDPYRTTASPAPQKAPRRTLDDMRKLSEEIERTRQRKERGAG